MAVMHVGDHAVVVEHTPVMPSCGPSPDAACVRIKHRIPCAMRGRAVWRTVDSHEGVPVGSIVDVRGHDIVSIRVHGGASDENSIMTRTVCGTIVLGWSWQSDQCITRL